MKKPTLTRAQRPPASLTRDRFLVWRSPRRGVFNGQRVTNPAWAWLARSKLNAWQANAWFGGPSSTEVGPYWSMDRFGQSRTELRDGRVVEIAGEHEDHSDPDFFIYNDVVVRGPGRELEIFAYPTHVFPPTDFHSATLLGERIVTVGSLGYPGDRRVSETPVFCLDTSSWQFSSPRLQGPAPGWIWNHTARAQGLRLTLRGGSRLVVVGGRQHIVDNFDDWQLDLKAGRWTRLTRRPWQQWTLECEGPHTLFEISMLKYHLPVKNDFDREQVARWMKDHGALPDLELYDGRYAPPVEFVALPQREEKHSEFAIEVDGVKLRFVEQFRSVDVTVEGRLPPRTLTRVLAHVRKSLARLAGRPFDATRVQ